MGCHPPLLGARKSDFLSPFHKGGAMKRLFIAVLFLLSFTALSFAEDSATQAPAEQPKVQEAAAPFTIATLVECTGIENREPAGVAETFPSTEKVYTYLEATDISADTAISFVWYLDGQKMDTITLQLRKGPRWRTYASKQIAGRKGNWKVDVLDEAGNLLKSTSFKTE
jgi:hypothetical protein